jgi:hypothetical protein
MMSGLVLNRKPQTPAYVTVEVHDAVSIGVSRLGSRMGCCGVPAPVGAGGPMGGEHDRH